MFPSDGKGKDGRDLAVRCACAVSAATAVQAWVNPVLAKRVTVRASSPAARHTDPKALCGEKFMATHFAGPRCVELGM